MFRLCVLLILGLLTSTAGSQTLQNKPDPISSNITLAFNGSIIYPGFRGGIERPIKRIDITKYGRQAKVRHFSKYRYFSAELGFYHHPTFHDNFYLLAGWQMRKVHPRGFFTEFSPGLGYSRTFLGGETYLVDDAGNISLLKGAGYNYIMASIGGGLGWKIRSAVSAHIRTCLLTMFPSNNVVYFRPSIELGAIWRPKHFWLANPKVISTTKGKHAS